MISCQNIENMVALIDLSPQFMQRANDGTEDCRLVAEARKQRKRTQNRINQRAHRSRKATEELKSSHSKPFRVVRYRLDNSSSESDSGDSFGPSGSSRQSLSGNSITNATWSPSPLPDPQAQSDLSRTRDGNSLIEIEFPLSSDHLIHLIYHTVFRALTINKDLLKHSAVFTEPYVPVLASQPTRGLCGPYTVIHPGKDKIPESLIPTDLQMTQPHSCWIDMFPFERFRDNLIKNEDSFNHEEICRDLFGPLINDAMPSSRFPDIASGILSSPKVDEDPITADRRGLIVWGEPHDKRSWEVTPGFISKWAWVLDGVDELIEISNQWRALRGEDPIRLSLS